MLIYRVMRDDGSMLAYRIAMRQLERTEATLRTMRKWMVMSDEPFYWQVGQIIQVAIDRAMSARVRLVAEQWKN
jgi:hypothetical protein